MSKNAAKKGFTLGFPAYGDALHDPADTYTGKSWLGCFCFTLYRMAGYLREEEIPSAEVAIIMLK